MPRYAGVAHVCGRSFAAGVGETLRWGNKEDGSFEVLSISQWVS
jgi:hypothetical protein